MGLGKLALSAAAYKAAAEELEAPQQTQPSASTSTSNNSARRPLLAQSGSGSYGATRNYSRSPEAIRRQESGDGIGVSVGRDMVLDDEGVERLLDEAGLYVGMYLLLFTRQSRC